MNKYKNFCWPDGKIGALTSSWDDGTVYDIKLIEILNRYGIKGTFNLNSGKLGITAEQSGWKSYVNPDEISDLYKGHEIAAHTVTHPHLDKISDNRVVAEINDDCQALKKIVGYDILGFALPYGTFDKRISRLIKQTDIAYVRPVEEDKSFLLPQDFHFWKPTCHHDDDLSELWNRFLISSDSSKLFYLWGHSYEFEDNNNWSHIEKFCELTGGNESIWYATNIEIYDYVVDYLESL